MNLQLNNLSPKPLELTGELPVNFAGVRLPAGSPLTVIGSFGDICIQQIEQPGFMVGYHAFRIKENIVLRADTAYSGLFFRLMLKNQLRYQLNDFSEISPREAQFTLLYAKQPTVTMKFIGEDECICFDVFFDESLLQEILILFPDLKHHFRENATAWLIHRGKLAGPEILNVVDAIMYCRYQQKLCLPYIESRIKDLLFECMLGLREKPGQVYQAAKREISAVREAEAFIRTDLARPLLISALARQAGMNEYHFKMAFKQVFGTGLYEYRQTKRLELAGRMLASGQLTVKEAAISAGYTTANFVYVFRKYFGYTPGKIYKDRHR